MKKSRTQEVDELFSKKSMVKYHQEEEDEDEEDYDYDDDEDFDLNQAADRKNIKGALRFLKDFLNISSRQPTNVLLSSPLIPIDGSEMETDEVAKMNSKTPQQYQQHKIMDQIITKFDQKIEAINKSATVKGYQNATRLSMSTQLNKPKASKEGLDLKTTGNNMFASTPNKTGNQLPGFGGVGMAQSVMTNNNNSPYSALFSQGKGQELPNTRQTANFKQMDKSNTSQDMNFHIRPDEIMTDNQSPYGNQNQNYAGGSFAQNYQGQGIDTTQSTYMQGRPNQFQNQGDQTQQSMTSFNDQSYISNNDWNPNYSNYPAFHPSGFLSNNQSMLNSPTKVSVGDVLPKSIRDDTQDHRSLTNGHHYRTQSQSRSQSPSPYQSQIKQHPFENWDEQAFNKHQEAQKIHERQQSQSQSPRIFEQNRQPSPQEMNRSQNHSRSNSRVMSPAPMQGQVQQMVDQFEGRRGTPMNYSQAQNPQMQQSQMSQQQHQRQRSQNYPQQNIQTPQNNQMSFDQSKSGYQTPNQMRSQQKVSDFNPSGSTHQQRIADQTQMKQYQNNQYQMNNQQTVRKYHPYDSKPLDEGQTREPTSKDPAGKMPQSPRLNQKINELLKEEKMNQLFEDVSSLAHNKKYKKLYGSMKEYQRSKQSSMYDARPQNQTQTYNRQNYYEEEIYTGNQRQYQQPQPKRSARPKKLNSAPPQDDYYEDHNVLNGTYNSLQTIPMDDENHYYDDEDEYEEEYQDDEEYDEEDEYYDDEGEYDDDDDDDEYEEEEIDPISVDMNLQDFYSNPNSRNNSRERTLPMNYREEEIEYRTVPNSYREQPKRSRRVSPKRKQKVNGYPQEYCPRCLSPTGQAKITNHQHPPKKKIIFTDRQPIKRKQSLPRRQPQQYQQRQYTQELPGPSTRNSAVQRKRSLNSTRKYAPPHPIEDPNLIYNQRAQQLFNENEARRQSPNRTRTYEESYEGGRDMERPMRSSPPPKQKYNSKPPQNEYVPPPQKITKKKSNLDNSSNIIKNNIDLQGMVSMQSQGKPTKQGMKKSTSGYSRQDDEFNFDFPYGTADINFKGQLEIRPSPKKGEKMRA